MLPLGSKVKDKVTGFIGTITCRSEYLAGCVRYSVEPPVDKEGKLPETVAFDEERLEIIPDPIPDVKSRNTGGYQPDLPSRRELQR
jgi:hypothetical protein